MPVTRATDEVAIGRRAVAKLRTEIGRIDPAARSAYVRAFEKEFAAVTAESTFDDLVIDCYKADLIYIGDFHALPRSQEFAARLLHEISCRSGRTVLAVEMVHGRHQHVLDRWMAGEISETEFLRRIRYHLEWGYSWAAFSKLFEVAREHGIRVYGIDSAPRNGIRHIRQRDRHMASRISGIFAERPDAKVVVVVGESHLATSHLPAAVRDALARRNVERHAVRVFQNLDEPYWRHAAGHRDGRDTVLVGSHVHCVFNATPLEKMEAYRQTIERWNQDRPGDEEIDLTPTVYGMIDSILKFLGVSKFRRAVRCNGARRAILVDTYPEIYSSVDGTEFERMLESQRIPPQQIEEVRFHMSRNGSCYVPRINAIYIGEFSLVHGGEEASHFVNHALRGDIFCGPADASNPDQFYSAVMEEALGYFGSKLIDPSRNNFFETAFYQHYRSTPEEVELKTGFSYAEFRRVIDFILLHKKFERTYAEYDHVPAELLDGIRTNDARLFSILTHELGYFLGQQLHDGVHGGAISREEIRALYAKRYERSTSAFRVYLELTERLPGGFEEPGRS
ncbi:MAG TPA: ChaN family lipoprotein [Candidatus Saccharimonadales bacterium]|nr:ChaN family lipoprotein [Candidatus Saccharimonadales bacterium]